MGIHSEGRKILIIAFFSLLAVNLVLFYYAPLKPVFLYLIAGVSFLLFLFLLQFFRNPFVKVLYDQSNILAPADGKVVVVEKTVEHECLQEERIQISIFMSPVDVHINRSPARGQVKYIKYHPGKYLVAWHPKSSTLNERTTMLLGLKNGVDIVVRQIAGIMARRIKVYVQQGDQLEQGQEFGFIKFGSRVDVFVPLDADILVKPGMRARAGKTIMAVLNV